MEEDGDNLENLFEEYESNDRQPQENENAEEVATEPEKVPVPKRVVKHPRLKFNPERLCGKRGIPILVDHFKGVKFKGKGHEKEDLNKLLTTLELWTHRLFPSMKFEDCLRQIEHLGKKRPVKTCLQKIRLDFPVLDTDFVSVEDEEEESQQPNELEPEPSAEDAFDKLFDGYQENAHSVISSTPNSSQSAGNVLGSSFGASISEEQKKRMEYNKLLAIERRKARMSAMESSSIVNSTVNTSEVVSVNNSQLSVRSENNDRNFLFDCLQHQFASSEYSNNKNEKTEGKCSQSIEAKDKGTEIDKTMKSAEGDKETNQDVPSKVGNNDFMETNDKVELGFDELMDLVDECDKDETGQEALSNVKNNEAEYSQSIDGKESEILKAVDEGGKDETDGSAKSNIHNDYCSKNNNVELALDELMDLVDESDEDLIDDDAMSSVKN